MRSASDSIPTQTAPDYELACPRCGYNVFGLPEPRCPECGRPFTLEETRVRRSPTIAFERARGLAKCVGFLQTWFTVLLLPWVFARQAVQRTSLGHGLLFGGVCYAILTALVVLQFGWESLKTISVTVPTAALYIVIQALLLTLLDVRHWRNVGRSYLFWLAIGGYTTAVVILELRTGPPPIFFSELLRFVAESDWSWAALNDNYYTVLSGWYLILIFGLWLWGIAFVLHARLRERDGARWFALLAALFSLPLLFALYTVLVEHVGANLSRWLYPIRYP